MSHDRIRQPISIQALLAWAYCDQMVHQAKRPASALDRRRKADAPRAAQSTVFNVAAPIDASTVTGFEAAPDAWRIHDRVMELGVVKVDCGPDLAAMRYYALPQFRGAEPPTGQPGNADVTGRPWPTDGILKVDTRALVMIHASRDTMPDTYPAADFRLKGEQLVRHKTQKGGVYQRGWFQHVVPVGITPGDVAQADALYAAWRDALDRLAVTLRAATLTMWSVTDDLPPPGRNPGWGLD